MNFCLKKVINILLKKKILGDEIISDLKIVLNYYKNYFPETKKEDIDLLEKAIEKKEEFDYKKYLDNNLEEMKNKNNRFKIIEFLLEKNNKNRTEKNIKDIEKSFNNAVKVIKDKRFTKLKKRFKRTFIRIF